MANKLATVLTLGRQYGPLTLDYARRVERVGGRFSSPRALSLVDNLIYGQYSDGAGGSGVLAGLATLPMFWAPICDFPGITEPIIGNSFVNNGFVSGDWNITTGLLGGTGKYLDSGINVSTLTQNNAGLGFLVDSVPTAATTRVLGARNVTSSECFDIGFAVTTGALQSRIMGNATVLTAATPPTFCAVIRSNSGTNIQRYFQNTRTQVASNSVAFTNALNLYVGGSNAGGGLSAPFTGRIRMVFQSGNLIEARLNQLYNAVVAYDAERAAL
jgi:hypothetical protein